MPLSDFWYIHKILQLLTLSTFEMFQLPQEKPVLISIHSPFPFLPVLAPRNY